MERDVQRRLLTMRTVIAEVSLSRTEIWRRVQRGTFPKPIRLGPQRIAFVASEIDAWVNARVAERDAPRP